MAVKALKDSDWGRNDLVRKYSTYDMPYIIMTVDVDVTHIYHVAKSKGLSFYMAMIYAVMHTAMGMTNFHYRLDKQGEPVYCDGLTASFTYLPKGWENFYVVNKAFEGDFEDFCKSAKAQAEAQATDSDRGIMCDPEDLGVIYISALPWIHFNHMMRTIEHGGKDNIPRISWGKYDEDLKGRLMMPLALQVHHGLMDGFHVGMYYQKLQAFMDSL